MHSITPSNMVPLYGHTCFDRRYTLSHITSVMSEVSISLSGNTIKPRAKLVNGMIGERR